MPTLLHRATAGLIALLASALIVTTGSAAEPGLAFPAPAGTTWEVLAGYNTPTHEGVDPYALDLWRVDGKTGGTALLSPMSGTLGYISDTCVSVRTSEVNLLMCHVHALPGLERGDPIVVGQRLGTVAEDGDAENGGTAHIHLQLNSRTDGRSGDSLPFDGAFVLEGVALPATTAANGHAGARFTSTNDPANAVASVSAGPDRTVEAGATVSLTAITRNVDQVQWLQTSGPVLTLTGNGIATTFVAPAEPGAVVVLQVYGAGPLGVASDEITITVRPPLGESHGRIISGSVSSSGISLVVFGGGTGEELALAAGCGAPSVSFWATSGGRLIGYLPGAGVPLVNAPWLQAFPEGLPAATPILVRCV